MWHRALLGAAAVTLLAATARPAGEGPAYVIVVHSTNPSRTIAKRLLSDLFLKKAARWPGTREAAAPADQLTGSLVRRAFTLDVHGRSVGAVKNYWHQMIFSGRAVPPPELASDARVAEFVRARPGAVGYVAPDFPLRDLKVLEVEP